MQHYIYDNSICSKPGLYSRGIWLWETQFMFAQVLIWIKQNKRQMGLKS